MNQNGEENGHLQPWLLEQWQSLPEMVQNSLIPVYAQQGELLVAGYVLAQVLTLIYIYFHAKERGISSLVAVAFAFVAQFPLNLLIWIIIEQGQRKSPKSKPSI